MSARELTRVAERERVLALMHGKYNGTMDVRFEPTLVAAVRGLLMTAAIVIAQIHAASFERVCRMETGGAVPPCRPLERRLPADGGAELRNFQQAGGYFCRYPGTHDVVEMESLMFSRLF